MNVLNAFRHASGKLLALAGAIQCGHQLSFTNFCRALFFHNSFVIAKRLCSESSFTTSVIRNDKYFLGGCVNIPPLLKGGQHENLLQFGSRKTDRPFADAARVAGNRFGRVNFTRTRASQIGAGHGVA